MKPKTGFIKGLCCGCGCEVSTLKLRKTLACWGCEQKRAKKLKKEIILPEDDFPRF